MSNSIYNILNNFNKVAQEPTKPATQKPTTKSKLQESVEGVLNEKYMGFKKVAAAAKAGGAENPEAVAASIGRKKYGKEKFQKAAAAGKKLGESNNPFANVNPRVEKPTIQGTTNKAKSGYYPPSKPPVQKLARPIDEVDMAEGTVMEYDRSLAIPASKALIVALPRMSKLGYTQEDKACVEKFISFLQRGDTHKARRYQKRGGCTIRASNFIDEILSDANINPDAEFQQPVRVDPRSRKQGMSARPINELSPDTIASYQQKAYPQATTTGPKSDQRTAGIVRSLGRPTNEDDMEEGNEFSGALDAARDAGETEFKVGGRTYPVKESVRAIKQLKSKKTKNKVEETIQSLLSAGFTKEQIIEGWDDMMKSVEKSHRNEKGTGKFDNKKISTGTVYTRKYNPKTGETDDTENVTKEKRGRGRPKKNAFEGKYSSANKMLSEQYSFIEGRIEGGVWVDKPGNVPVPQNPEVAPPLSKTGTTGKPTQDSTKSSNPSTQPKSKTVKEIANPENDKEEEKMQEALNQMRRIAGLPVIESKADKKADDDYDNDGKIESGKDEYLGSKIRAARDAGKLGEGKMCKKCDCDPCECDKEKVDECSSPMGNGMMGQESDGKMNITTNMNSDGHKSVTITADGEAASDLMQMLKLAGMQGGEGHSQQEPAGVMVVSTGDEDEVEENLEIRANPAGASSAEQAKAIGAQSPQQGGKEPNYAYKIGEEEVEEAKDERYHASTTPDEQVSSVQAQTKGGNGDVAGQEKRMRKGGYQFGDNNLAMKDVYEGIDGLEVMGRKLYKEYQSIKVQK
jgi:hypothetical protein